MMPVFCLMYTVCSINIFNMIFIEIISSLNYFVLPSQVGETETRGR